MGFVLDGILDWFAAAILDVLDALIGAITGVLLVTPDVTALPQVQALAGRSLWIVDAVFVLVFVAVGVLTMTAGGDERARYTVKDLLPRCVFGFIAAHFSQLLAGKLIETANAVTAALTDGDLDGGGALTAVRTHVAASRGVTTGLLFVACAAIIVMLLAATAFSVVVRFVVALVLTCIAPLALACHALPQTDPLARLWWRSYLGVLAVPIVQGLFLFAGQWMLLDTGHMLPLLGLPGEPAGVMNLIIVIVLLWTTVQVPGLMSRYVSTGGRGQNPLGAVARVVVVQQLTRTVPGLARTARAAIR